MRWQRELERYWWVINRVGRNKRNISNNNTARVWLKYLFYIWEFWAAPFMWQILTHAVCWLLLELVHADAGGCHTDGIDLRQKVTIQMFFTPDRDNLIWHSAHHSSPGCPGNVSVNLPHVTYAFAWFHSGPHCALEGSRARSSFYMAGCTSLKNNTSEYKFELWA